MKYGFVPLSRIINEWTAEDIDKCLGGFVCSMDRGLEYFLRNRAIEFEKRDLARTFLLFDQERVAGYISLATTVLEVRADWPVSNALKKRMNVSGGPSAAFLIGQMCKANGIEDKLGPLMIKMALTMFDGAREICGGRVVCVDCKKELLEFYKENGFKVISNPSEGGLYRLAILYN